MNKNGEVCDLAYHCVNHWRSVLPRSLFQDEDAALSSKIPNFSDCYSAAAFAAATFSGQDGSFTSWMCCAHVHNSDSDSLVTYTDQKMGQWGEY